MNYKFIKEEVLVHTPTLLQYANKFTQDHNDAEDLLQNTLIKVLKYQKKYVTGTNLLGWIYTIMRNTFINDCRRRVHQLKYINGITDSKDIESRISRDRAEGNLMSEEINTVMKTIPEIYYNAFMMYYEGFKYYEIAEYLGVPEGTVKTRIHTARKILQKKLRNYRHD
ncbi:MULTISPECIES: RNA polymerase sigma factor [Sphingobacterium]|uniref:RNA polymerase sigma factor n=1 Tax=Sphingobacterium TaxID=28453 RepID=UPI00162A97E7|nr:MULTISPECIES: RNA polymerase sigma factor [Sphingobacterium]MBV2227606.1 RNA polymerase sigma factor [Sphingobacterium mizutaii]